MPRRGLPETVRMRHDEHYVEALAASAGTPVGRMVPIDLIDPNPNQPRQVMGDLSELMASIAEKGIIEPLVLRQRGDRYQIIAGERRYQAAVQVGIKELPGVIRDADDTEIMEIALNQAHEGRIHILGEMAKALGIPRPEMRETVPRVTTIQIPTDKIGAVIGSGGKTIREITERTGTKIDIQDDGTVKIAATDPMASQRAVDWIRGLTASPEVGTIYEGRVARIVDFGAFINFLGSIDGLCHISEISNERVGKVSDVLKEGDMVKVKVLAIDDRGKIKLSMRAVDQVTGEPLEVQPRPPRPPREGDGERGDRGERREGGFRRRRGGE